MSLTITFQQEFAGGPRADDLLSSLRSGPSAPVQKSQNVMAGKLPDQPHRIHINDLHQTLRE